jgi:predicted CopG family antitoxin
MHITITEQEYKELLKLKREHEFMLSRLYTRIKELDEKSKKLNKTAFKINRGDTVQNMEWVKLHYEISLLFYFVPNERVEALEELLA